jgi:hypothetical protein
MLIDILPYMTLVCYNKSAMVGHKMLAVQCEALWALQDNWGLQCPCNLVAIGPQLAGPGCDARVAVA